MTPEETPDQTGLLALMDHRDEVCVTIALASSPSPRDHERIRIALRDAIDEAERRMHEREVAAGTRNAVLETLRGLLTDDEFWGTQSDGLVVLASPGRTAAYRLPSHVRDIVAVADRFQAAPLLRAATDDDDVYVLQLAEGLARLTRIGADGRVVEQPLSLPDDHESVLEQAENDGRFDMRRAQGAKGDRIEHERYCRVVQDEVARIVPDGACFVLAASSDLAPAYRAVSTQAGLTDDGIDAHPGSLDDRALADAARSIVEDAQARATSAWKERFGTLRAQGLATSRLVEVAAAAAEAAIDELRFDREADATGTIDEFGQVEREADATPLVDEIAARVLHSGGRVRAVRRRDLVDGSPVAATLRFPVTVPR
ncbi:hypothetical protein ACFC3F_11160 [Microbacterium sp. NPDC055910]|uniref:baeRF11 domain-containing protein n=1 Tax=Microbacterium sp. NPDC055910 TaxID=3345659 RepID=UPI0035DF3166